MMKSRRRCGFTLAELLIAMFVLGIGVIAVAALFPAGIRQQQQSVDDVIGGIVAANAVAIIRRHVDADDFGTFEAFVGPMETPTIPGDWPWMRPAFVFPGTEYPFGAIDVFNATALATAVESPPAPYPGLPSGIPYNVERDGATRPVAVISQLERRYPMVSIDDAVGTGGGSRYVWECMFRRYQGRIQVAVFVYRVNLAGGGQSVYVVPPDPGDPTRPPLPIGIDLAADGPLPWQGRQWDADGDVATSVIEPSTLIAGTEPGTPFDAADHAQAWQLPSQWLLDQNNNVHKVLSGRRHGRDGPVELHRAIAMLPDVAPYWLDRSVPRVGIDGVVRFIWYLPDELNIDTDLDGDPDTAARVVCVHVTVQEL